MRCSVSDTIFRGVVDRFLNSFDGALCFLSGHAFPHAYLAIIEATTSYLVEGSGYGIAHHYPTRLYVSQCFVR